MLREAGCPPDKLVETKVAHSSLPNVVCTIAGDTDRMIVVGAHFDKVHEGQGVADNWSGAASGFTDEEKGLVGSADYVKHMNREQRANVAAMVNLDTLGLAPAEVWASHADKNLLQALATVASMKLPISVMNVDGVGSSDSESFHDSNMPALTIHSVTLKNFSILHSPKDTLQTVQLNDYLETFRLMCGYLAYLDIYLDQPLTTGTHKPQ